MTPEQIENLRVEKLKELKKAEDNLHTVKVEFNRLEREIAEKRLEQKKLREGLEMASQVVKQLKLDVSIKTIEFYQARR